jgi:ribosome-associated toxin RatA of RatAB toxin-antitoxin module
LQTTGPGITLQCMSLEGAQEFSTEVAASVRDCFATITDFDSYPAWSSAVQQIAVLERRHDGLARLVEFHVDMTIKTVRYVLEYDYDGPEALRWQSVDGDLESIEGAYTFEKLKAKQTMATCQQVVAIGFWVPGPILHMIERTALQQSVLEFKREAEARTRKAPARGQARKRGDR